MTPGAGPIRLDPLHIFAMSIAAFLAATLFLLAVLANVSIETALTRAIIGWAVLSILGIGASMLVRWILQVPPPSAHSRRLDVTLPSTDPAELAGGGHS